MATIHVPILLDVSGNVEVFGEKVAKATNFFDAHHYFQVDCHKSGNTTGQGVTVGKLKNLLKFQDAESGGALFTIGHASTDNGLTEKKALLVGLRKAICGMKESDGSTDPGTQTHDSECCLVHVIENEKMPDGDANTSVAAIANKAGENGKVLKQQDNAYANAITSSTQTEQTLGDAVLRYVATHLSGHPLGQAFVKNDSALIAQINGGVNEEKAANITGTAGSEKFVIPANVLGSTLTAANAKNACLPEQIVNALVDGLSGGTTNTANGAATPASNAIVQSIYEQMVAQKAERFEGLVDTTTNVTGTGDQNPVSIPFQAGDIIVLYVRINVQTEVDSSVFGGDATPSTAGILPDIFPPSQFKRMRHEYENDADGTTYILDVDNSGSVGTGKTYKFSQLQLNTWRIDLTIGGD